MSDDDPVPAKWISVLVAAAMGAASSALTIAAYAYQNFETIDHAREKNSFFEKRLDILNDQLRKIDDKLDRVLESGWTSRRR